MATFRELIGCFEVDGHVAGAEWRRNYGFDQAREDSGPTCTNGARRMAKKAEGVQLARTNLGADWLEGLRTGPRRAGLEREKRAHLRALEVRRTRPIGAAGGGKSRLCARGEREAGRCC